MATTKLGWEQAIKNSYDESSESLRTTLANLQVAIELSADDGDSVEIRNPLLNSKFTVNANISSGSVIGIGDAKYTNNLSILTNTLSNITATGLKVVVDFSPSDTDNVWYTDSSLDCAVKSTTVDPFTLVKGISIGVWRRVRIRVVHSGFTGGSFDLYVNGR